MNKLEKETLLILSRVSQQSMARAAKVDLSGGGMRGETTFLLFREKSRSVYRQPLSGSPVTGDCHTSKSRC